MLYKNNDIGEPIFPLPLGNNGCLYTIHLRHMDPSHPKAYNAHRATIHSTQNKLLFPGFFEEHNLLYTDSVYTGNIT